MKKALLYSHDSDISRGEESLSLVDTKSDSSINNRCLKIHEAQHNGAKIEKLFNNLLFLAVHFKGSDN